MVLGMIAFGNRKPDLPDDHAKTRANGARCDVLSDGVPKEPDAIEALMAAA